MRPPPPGWASWLLECALPRDIRDDVCGDLEEVYHAQVASCGLRQARFWYCREALLFAARFLGERLRDQVLALEPLCTEHAAVQARNLDSNDALFAHLFASQQARERRAFWIAGALLNLPIALLLLQFSLPQDETRPVFAPAAVTGDQPVMLLEPDLPAAARAEESPNVLVGASGGGSAAAPTRGTTDRQPPTPSNGEFVLLNAPQGDVPAGSGRSTDDRLPAAASAVLLPRRVGPVSVPRYEGPRSILVSLLARFNDSLRAEQGIARAADDWTVKDSEDRRSGFSPGTVHGRGVAIPVVYTLGDSTVRADVFRPPPGRRDEWSARTRLWLELHVQAARAEAAAVFDDRVRQIRARKNSDRNARDSGGSSSRIIIAL